jgi:hypothetical protein
MSFSVENADFIADKLAAELLPNQEYREVYINAVEAVQRELKAREAEHPYQGRIEFDVDWYLLGLTGRYYVSCADNGDGMSYDDLQKYTTTLAVRGANANQTLSGNQGMGLKISGPTRHPEGVLIRSLHDGHSWMVQIGKDEDGYGFIALGPDDERIMPADLGSFPEFIRKAGSGTVVTFLGKHETDETFVSSPKNWLFKYLNARVFGPHDDRIKAYVRQPAGDRESWPADRAEAQARQSWNLAEVKGTGRVWSESSVEGDVMDVPGDAAAGIPPAQIHWYLLDPDKDPSSRTYGGGSVAVRYQEELHDWRYGGQASATFARAGILYGKPRVGLIVEPHGDTVRSDFARAHVLVGGTQLTGHEAWNYYFEYFRENRPQAILDMMAEEQARLTQEDPERIKRINNRLKDVLAMLRPRRFRADSAGKRTASGTVTGPGDTGTTPSTVGGSGTGSVTKKRRRGIGSLLADVDAAGEAAGEIHAHVDLVPQWVKEAEAEGMTLLEGNGLGLKDRAAALLGDSAAAASVVVLNRDFSGYRALVEEANKLGNPEGDDLKAERIAAACEEWVEQKIVETVLSMRQLENGSSWMREHLDAALSPAGLTAAFMADRWHTWNEIKREIGRIG